jgi:hypothetical protein
VLRQAVGTGSIRRSIFLIITIYLLVALTVRKSSIGINQLANTVREVSHKLHEATTISKIGCQTIITVNS